MKAISRENRAQVDSMGSNWQITFADLVGYLLVGMCSWLLYTGVVYLWVDAGGKEQVHALRQVASSEAASKPLEYFGDRAGEVVVNAEKRVNDKMRDFSGNFDFSQADLIETADHFVKRFERWVRKLIRSSTKA